MKKKEVDYAKIAESLVKMSKDMKSGKIKMSGEVEAKFLMQRAADEASKVRGFTLGPGPKISAGLVTLDRLSFLFT